jgi:hypothetical protein
MTISPLHSFPIGRTIGSWHPKQRDENQHPKGPPSLLFTLHRRPGKLPPLFNLKFEVERAGCFTPSFTEYLSEKPEFSIFDHTQAATHHHSITPSYSTVPTLPQSSSLLAFIALRSEWWGTAALFRPYQDPVASVEFARIRSVLSAFQASARLEQNVETLGSAEIAVLFPLRLHYHQDH